MPCTTIRTPGGTAILCSRGRRAKPTCHLCGRPADYLCDGPGKGGGTCGTPMCGAHRIHVSDVPDRDLCASCADDEQFADAAVEAARGLGGKAGDG